jgi:hypothetical protein
MDEARDSFAMSNGFAFSSIQKVTKIKENLKPLKNLIQEADVKVDTFRQSAEKLSETSKKILARIQWVRANLLKTNTITKAKIGLDSLKGQYSFLDVRYLVESGKATSQLLIPHTYESKYSDMLRDLEDAQKNLKYARQFSPQAEELENEVKKSPTLPKAAQILTSVEKDIAGLKKVVTENQAKTKSTLGSFEKVNIEVKKVFEEMTKLEKEIQAIK